MSRLQKQPLAVYVPEVRPVQAVPAYCITETVFAGYGAPPASSGFGAGGGSSSVSGGVANFDAYGNVYYMGPLNAGGSVGAGSGSRPIYKDVVTCFPAVPGTPGVPARVDFSGSIGWNGGARSVEAMPMEGYFECRIPQAPAGIVIGLSDGEFLHSYGHASHAVVVRSTGMAPLSSGAELAESVPLVPGAIVRLERRDGVISAYVDGEHFHTFDTPSRGQLYADVTFYGLTDYVDDAKFGEFYARIDGVVPTPIGKLGNKNYADVEGTVPAMTLYALCGVVVGVSGTIPAPVGVISEGRYCRISGITPAMQLSARAGHVEPVQTGVLGFVPPMPLYSLTLTGTIARMDAVALAPVGRVSEGSYASVDAVWGGYYQLTSWEPYLPDYRHDGGDIIFAADFGSMINAVLFVSYDGIEISDSIDLVLLVSMEAYDYLGVGDMATLGGVIQLLAMERVAVSSTARSAQQEALQYAVNVLTGALTTYQNFGFTQFAQAGGETYAIKPDGLYRLREGDDNGDTVRAMIDFGASDYGVAQGKRVSSVYAGVTTDGEVYVRVTPDDGQEVVYRAIGQAPELRAPVAKGMKARHWRLRLELTDATYADLDNIEIELGVSQRRLNPRRR